MERKGGTAKNKRSNAMMGKRMMRTGGVKRGDGERRRGMELLSCGHIGGGSPAISMGMVLESSLYFGVHLFCL